MRITRITTRILALSLSAFAGPGSVLAQGMTPAPDFLVTTRSAHNFDETLSRIKQAVEGENLMVVQEVNPQQMLRMVGVQVGGMRQVFLFYPRVHETDSGGESGRRQGIGIFGSPLAGSVPAYGAPQSA